jgi:hypothetical protein
MRHLLVLSCVIVILLPNAPSAQFGAIGKKIGEAAKKKAGEPTDSTPKPAEGTPPPKAPATTASPYNNPNILLITDTSLTALERGLQTEIELRAAYKKELDDQAARAKQYEACSNQANTSPEMMAVAQKSASAYDNVKTQDDMIKAATKIAAERDAVIAQKCGPAVAAPRANDDRLTDIMRRAAAAASPIE